MEKKNLPAFGNLNWHFNYVYIGRYGICRYPIKQTLHIDKSYFSFRSKRVSFHFNSLEIRVYMTTNLIEILTKTQCVFVCVCLLHMYNIKKKKKEYLSINICHTISTYLHLRLDVLFDSIPHL